MPQRKGNGNPKTFNRSNKSTEHGVPPVSLNEPREGVYNNASSQMLPMGQQQQPSSYSSASSSTHIWHSPDLKERVGAGGGGVQPPLVPTTSPSRSFIISSYLTNQSLASEGGINNFGSRPTSLSASSAPFVVQESSTKNTKKKETAELSPRDFSPPDPTYVCFGCNVAGDHWRAFCPVRPLKGSLPPKARMIMLAAGANSPANLKPISGRDAITSGGEDLASQATSSKGHSFSLQPTNAIEGSSFSLQSRGSIVLNSISHGLSAINTADASSSSSNSQDDPLLFDLGLGFIAASDKDMKDNELSSPSLSSSSLISSTNAAKIVTSADPRSSSLTSSSSPSNLLSLNTSLSVSASFRGMESQSHDQSRGLSSLPPAGAGIWSDSSMLGQSQSTSSASSSSSSSSSSFFSPNSMYSGASSSLSSSSSSASPLDHHRQEGSGSKSLLPSLPPIPSSISNSVQSLSDKLNWISNGVRFIV